MADAWLRALIFTAYGAELADDVRATFAGTEMALSHGGTRDGEATLPGFDRSVDGRRLIDLVADPTAPVEVHLLDSEHDAHATFAQPTIESRASGSEQLTGTR